MADARTGEVSKLNEDTCCWLPDVTVSKYLPVPGSDQVVEPIIVPSVELDGALAFPYDSKVTDLTSAHIP